MSPVVKDTNSSLRPVEYRFCLPCGCLVSKNRHFVWDEHAWCWMLRPCYSHQHADDLVLIALVKQALGQGKRKKARG